MDYQLQVVTLSVSDIDKSAAFYTEQAGFTLDVDYHPAPGFRVVQLTPPGSACSIQIGRALTDASPGSARATYLAVTDIEAARAEFIARGVQISGIRHKSPVDGWQGGWAPGADPQRRDYASAAGFADPDGNTWVIHRAVSFSATTPENRIKHTSPARPLDNNGGKTSLLDLPNRAEILQRMYRFAGN
jgi:catechol 2,3-dioxygenase-like lactoylglutathione lyase family enzyme